MALVVANRVKDTTLTTGTGPITLSGTPPTGYQSFGAGIGNGNSTYYTIAGVNTSEWEVGIGTYTASGTSLSRDTVLSSSNGGALVPFSAGTKDVFVTYPAEKTITNGYGLLPVGNGGTGTATQFTAGSVVFAGTSGVYTQDNANLFWDNTNNLLGIGNASPAYTLDVNGSVRFSDSTAAGPDIIFTNLGGNTAINNSINGRFYIGAFETIFTNFDNSAERMRIDSNGNVGIGTTTNYGGRLTVVPATTPTTFAGANQVQIGESSSNTGYRLQLGYLNDPTYGLFSSIQSYGAGSPNNLILNGAGGNVGIGYSSPTSKLTVGGRIQAAGAGTVDVYVTTTDGGGSNLVLSATSTGAGEVNMVNGFPLVFKTANTERARITSAGNLLVGTTTANGTLSVVGDQISIGGVGSGNLGLQIKGFALTAIPAGQVQGYIATGDSAIGTAGDLLIAPRTDATASIRFITGTTPAERVRIDSSGNLLVTGAGVLGYGTGSGGAVTQTGSRTTGVTLDKTNGAITLVSDAGTTTWTSFTVTNSTVSATDTIIINQQTGSDLYEIHITAVSAGSFRVSFRTTGGTTTEQPVFNFSVINAVTA